MSKTCVLNPLSPKTITFEAFLEAAGPQHVAFIRALHNDMLSWGCTVGVKSAALGYVVSYVHKASKRTVMNYVFRKKGLMMRIYADNVLSYMEVLNGWPINMKFAVRKAGVCKRLADPEACSSHCLKGFYFCLDDQWLQRCRYGGFMFLLDEETKPHLRDMMAREMEARQAAQKDAGRAEG